MFDVMSRDTRVAPVCCSYCTQPVPLVVILPISSEPDDSWLDDTRAALVAGEQMEGAP